MKGVKSVDNNNTLIDLYSVSPKVPGPERPFVHRIGIVGSTGELPIEALFDGGAMVAAMCSRVFARVKDRLGSWGPSDKLLRMANGVVVRSEATWAGRISLGGSERDATFEVFDSAGGWEFLFGKPLLRLFGAKQNFAEDVVEI
ncbi:hypothetical protein BD779DRAFT_1453601, partial [Infundibulicybe gibba]